MKIKKFKNYKIFLGYLKSIFENENDEKDYNISIRKLKNDKTRNSIILSRLSNGYKIYKVVKLNHELSKLSSQLNTSTSISKKMDFQGFKYSN